MRAKTSANLTPASGRQDHTTSPYATTSLVRVLVDRSQIQRTRPAIPSPARRCRVHRIPPRVRDDRDTPLWWGGMATVLALIWVRGNKYFLENPKEKTRQPCQQTARRANHAAVARMERSEIRDRRRVIPGFRCAPSGLR